MIIEECTQCGKDDCPMYICADCVQKELDKREGIIQGLIRQQHKSISKQRVREARGRLYRNLNQKGCLDDFFRELGLEDEKGGGVK